MDESNTTDNPLEEKIQQVVDEKQTKRITQLDIMPQAIKSRHMGEGVPFIRSDIAANRPVSGEMAGAIFFASDTFVLSVWSGTAWKTVSLS